MDVKLKTWLILALLLGTMAYAIAEEITLTTYYPSPRGVYQELKTAGDLVVGDITNPPAARLHVVGSGTAPALRVDDVPGDTSPVLVDAAGNVGIGTASPSQRLHVAGDALIDAGQLRVGNMTGDPTAIGDGAIYYNTASDTFRGSMAGTWGDLGLGPIWDSGCFSISLGGVYPFTHNLGSTPRFVLVYGSNSAGCSSTGILRHMDTNSLGTGGYALYPITATQVTLRISTYFGSDICSHEFTGCSDTAATHARIILMR